MKKYFKNLKERINNYLERMAEVNKKNFGSDKPRCCDLNRKNENHGSHPAHS